MTIKQYDGASTLLVGSWVLTDNGWTYGFAGDYGKVKYTTTLYVDVIYTAADKTQTTLRKKKTLVQWVCSTEAEAKRMQEGSIAFNVNAWGLRTPVDDQIEKMRKEIIALTVAGTAAQPSKLFILG